MRSEDDDVIASRTFERDDGEVVLLIHKPHPYTFNGDGEPDAEAKQCRYTIRFPDGDMVHRGAVGIDTMQALILTLSSVGADLRRKKGGQLRPAIRWLGGNDLGLTIPIYE